jgi:uncharacterized membrane protein
MTALPLHPVVNPFPVVATILAAGCLSAGAARPLHERGECVLGALAATVLMVLAALLALAYRRRRVGLWPVLALALASALATGITAHLGGRIAFGEPEASQAGP